MSTLTRFNYIKSYVLLFLIVFSTTVDLQAQFKAGLEFRPRTEYRHGYRELPEAGEAGILLTTQRTRLNFSYLWDDRLESFISFQDLRVWGENSLNTSEATLGLYQGWLRFRLDERFSFKIGRQEMEYDDLRLISNSTWRLQARSHDAALFNYHSVDSTFTVDIAGAFNNDRQALFSDFFDQDNYKNLALVWVNKKIGAFNGSLIFLNQGFQTADTTINHSQTFGVYFSQVVGRLNLSGSYYRQTGRDVQSRSVNAYMLSLEGTLGVTPKMRTGIGMDLLSGTEEGDIENRNNSFVPLYARRHRYFGNQDLFYVGGFQVIPGLLDVYVKTIYQINKKLTSKVLLHSFSTQRSISDPIDTDRVMKRNLGMEADIILKYKYDKSFSIEGGYTQYFATNTMEALKGRGDSDEIAHFIYLSLEFNPTFF